uniref:Retrovirus-related Pol polyprotein LINE-1 n=1 Tax=Cajanus cajan TaxID=3821 RepID=A0A151TA40_CAJCA|nr:Retrovirus-related Pol polyprotein LINE-1 [Cajanus cajan]KYP63887.1 Retrovirus-related Pol polyprotein LINE-1 [Cajanus cajan]
MGDFNAVLHDFERQGGSHTASYRGDRAFREVVQDCDFIDLGFQGDRNTNYFHGSTVVRRRKNRIIKLQDEVGVWVEDKAELENLVNRFYMELFTNSGGHEPFCFSKSFPELTSGDIHILEAPLSDHEIFAALKHMGSLKAPGPDGFQAIFYQTQWSTVGESLCQLIRDIQVEPSKVATLNHTLITLIPKVDNVSSLKQMRPISLCNVAYKVLTKALASRLHGMMAGLVGPNQCSFVPNRHTNDNIIITQEVIHSMNHKKGKKGWMAIKIDLEKAYDRLSWNFIKETLLDIGFPYNFVELV